MWSSSSLLWWVLEFRKSETTSSTVLIDSFCKNKVREGLNSWSFSSERTYNIRSDNLRGGIGIFQQNLYLLKRCQYSWILLFFSILIRNFWADPWYHKAPSLHIIFHLYSSTYSSVVWFVNDHPHDSTQNLALILLNQL